MFYGAFIESNKAFNYFPTKCLLSFAPFEFTKFNLYLEFTSTSYLIIGI